MAAAIMLAGWLRQIRFEAPVVYRKANCPDDSQAAPAIVVARIVIEF